MYGLVDSENKLVAYHEFVEPVEIYMDAMNDRDKYNFNIIHIKKKYRDEIIEKYDDLHLVRYKDTYIQSGYIVYIKLASEGIDNDTEYARDILLRIIETQNRNNKDNNKLMKAVEVLNKIINDDRVYTPSPEEIKRLKDHYDMYLLNTNIIDKYEI